VETEAVTGSLLSLLHQQYANGTWGAGAWLPPDNFSTALSLDALSLAGDNPVETAWSRRRAALSLMRTQHANGGWSFFALPLKNFSFLLYRGAAGYSRGSIEVTAASLQALVYASVPDLGQDVHVARAMSFLTNRQDVSGLWPADLLRSRLLASALAMEALTAGSSASNTAVLRGVRAMLQRQRPDGGWSDHYDQSSSVHHTALVLRALAGIPGVPSECLHRARTFLEKSVDLSELMWSHAASPMYLPAGFGPRIVPELTSLWALEALVPVGIPDRPRPRHRWRSRSLFDRSR